MFHFKSLKLLELGSNRLRSVPSDIGKLVNLEELWLGKNKITSMALPPLPKLRHLSMQNNRLEVWDSSFFTNASGLTNLYLGFNNLPDLLEDLEELWMNDCQIADLEEIRHLSSLKALQTIY